ncbi:MULTISPECIES: DNA/RNA non-specific endonuclease [Amycolatopsis]|uniref:DNA/RNA non-specific endonuclease n=1 Tax=Amycolatopsis thermalba TaxID=944492 RepID=A0ABY4NVY1_9PSEU|nr:MULTISPECIES: DNA/RNA non-specific endonuclease [Amycolatopsis]OXM71761.1 endonuclease [Amycolatopsis sp. KNN50.9b]UQS24222.1 DNA/RNA non-specific endonuclease [Amycolatopsis thermalba]
MASYPDRDAVEKRVHEREDDRQRKIAILAEPFGLARADEPGRVATRIDRLSRSRPDVRPVNPGAIARGEEDALRDAGTVLERIIRTDDLLGVGYLEGGVRAAKAVGRISIRDDRGRLRGYGTGSLVSPELLLTNHHVLGDAATAACSVVEFDYQDGPDGLPLPVKLFALDPRRFFAADQGLDFALVAVRAAVAALAPFGFNRLVEAEGKAIIGDYVTIVQHPNGERKQIALRENRIVDVLERFLHYETDTEPGSSGSPVFNDQWEVVALHHASVRAPRHGELGGVVNEGVRVSRLLAALRARAFPPEQQALLAGVFGEPSPVVVAPVTEAIRIDPDYANRGGYDPDFLAGHRIPLPALSPDLVPLAAVNRQATSEPRYVLPYHHFSVVLNKQRRLAFFTAVNIDGTTSVRLRREKDKWSLDPRVAEEEQTGERVYEDNPLDRGHLVRRLDPAWGPSREAAKAANDDTFHFTNCTPQHEDFNQNRSTWAGLEDYVLENADNRDLRVSVVTGPVLAADDDQYRGVRLPRQYFKVVAMVRQDGSLSATGYLLSQEQLLEGLEAAPAEFSYGAYRTFQVPVRRIESLTGLSFGILTDADPLAQRESATTAKEVGGPADLVL